MQKRNKDGTRALYFTEKLRKRMITILDFPCTVVEAPMGYGKTTAVREAMHTIDAKLLWQNVYDSGVYDFWMGFCHAFSELNKGLGDSLRQMSMPTDAVLRREMISLIQEVPMENHTFLVIDDYHFVKASEVDDFLAFFLRNLPEKFHIIVITRLAFLKDIIELQLKGFINHIGADTLEFEKSDIGKYYSVCGVNITEEEQNLLYVRSEGWISALYLFMLEYKMGGSFGQTRDIPELVRETVYIPLSDELKCFLNCICLFDTFTLKQAQYMWSKGNEQNLLHKLISHNAFIKQDLLTGSYQLHNIFTSCIREEFSKESEEIQKILWERAGEWYLKNNEYMLAMDCFYIVRDFERLLFAVAESKSYSSSGEYKKRIIKYISECPREIYAKHHFAKLVYARRLFTLNENELFIKTCNEFLRDLQEDKALDENTMDTLLGEYELVMSFTQYNNITKMSEHHQKACKLLKGSSMLLDTAQNWTFGSPSILYMFYRESGKLSNQLEVMKEAMPYFYKITDGHGMGAEYVMEAETYFFRGDFENAEIYAHRAISKAQSKQQCSIILCAEFLQVRIALNKGNYTEISSLLMSMRENLKRQGCYTLLYTMDLCEAYIYAQLGQIQKITQWIMQGDYSNTKVLFPAMPAVYWVYGRVLLEKGEYLKLIGLSEMFLKTASVFPNLLCHIYIYIHLAAAYERIYNRGKAMEQLKKALDLAMADSLYMPFVENGKYIGDMIREWKLHGEYKYMFFEFHNLYMRYNNAVDSICKECFVEEKHICLTDREKEVAEFVAQGFSNKEIAKQLYITENTVKSRMKGIFRKLSIKSRAQLEDYINKKN
jgi:LuxR family maltose regulon positive regulatory protein